jgi:hypothetical protein
MAGDWIKMRMDLPEDPAVYRLARLTSLDRLSVVGRLYAFWAWADKHAVDGRVDGGSSADVDDIVSHEGFADAMVKVNWLEVGDEYLAIPKHDRHNGESAKERSLKNARQARWREKKDDPPSTPTSTKPSTREEKRREEKKNTPLPPAGGCKRFEEFWTAWPKSDRKQDKVKCADKWRRGSLDLQAEAILADLDRRKGGRKWREADGQYIEAPLTYLNGKRWEDGADIDAEAVETFL